jgi:uncharacterized membrane protein YgcG
MNIYRSRVRPLLLGAAVLSLVASIDVAVGQGPVLPTITVAQFRDNPSVLLRSPNLTNDVALLLAADHSLLNMIIGLVPRATSDQKLAIINALAQVANSVKGSNPGFAQSIQVAVADLRDQTLIGAFDAATGQQTTAAAGGGGGGGSGGGGPTGSGPPFGGANGGGGQGVTSGVSSFVNLLTGGTVQSVANPGTSPASVSPR